MKSISFKNFRRFTEFPEFTFGDITILVGANNAGKSTLVKAINFIINGIKNCQIKHDNTSLRGLCDRRVQPYFLINSEGEYARIHNNNNDSNIEYSIQLGEIEKGSKNYRFELNILFETMNANDDLLIVKKISLIDKALFLKFDIDSEQAIIEWVESDNRIILTDDMGDIEVKSYYDEIIRSKGPEYENIDTFINFNRDRLKEFAPEESDDDWYYYHKNVCEININHRKNLLKSVYDTCGFNAKAMNKKSGFAFDEFHKSGNFSLLFVSIIDYTFGRIGLGNIWEVKAENNKYKDLEYLRSRITESLRNFEKEILKFSIWQLPIHSLKRTITYSDSHPLYSLIRGFKQIENSELVKDRHQVGEYTMLTLSNKTNADLFREYLKDFEIANDYRISTLGGMIYTFEVLDKNDKWIHLTDIGTGPVRLIEIMLFLLCAWSGTCVFIEEPEQNLHPKLQSKLADLFTNVWSELGIKVIVETHSEYLVRRSQVLVAEMNLSEEDLDTKNPFKVYYFPEEGVPYDMKYRKNGYFEESFGKGFFDEAHNWTRLLMINSQN